ncbi:MAG: hypothetical protein ACOCUW_04190 [Gemmatimonadota bacterium]
MTGFTDLRPMTVGEILDRSFQVLRQHVGTLFVTALIGILPLLGLYLTMAPYAGAVSPEAMAAMTTLFLVFYLLILMTTAVSWGALTRDVNRVVRGEPVSLTDGLRHGLRAFFRIAGLWLLVTLAAVGAFLVPVLGAAIVLVGVSVIVGEGVLAGLLTFGLVLAALAIGLLLWAPVAFMGLPALMVEGLGPLRSLRRAHELGKGGRLRVTVTAFVAWLIVTLPAIGVPFLLGIGAALWDPAAAGTATATQLYLYQAISFLVTGLTTPFMVAVMVFTYYDRRVRREGYDVELVAESIPTTG